MKKTELRKLRKNLPKKYAAKLAVEFGVNPGHIYNVAGGRRKNTEILRRLVQLAKENTKEQSKIAETIKKI